jgi:hypothetical protein
VMIEGLQDSLRLHDSSYRGTFTMDFTPCSKSRGIFNCIVLEMNQFYRQGFSEQPNNLPLLLAKKTDKTQDLVNIK